MTDDDRTLPQRTAAEAAAALTCLDLCRWLAIHDVGLGNGKQSRRIQRAAAAAARGDQGWCNILKGRAEDKA